MAHADLALLQDRTARSTTAASPARNGAGPEGVPHTWPGKLGVVRPVSTPEALPCCERSRERAHCNTTPAGPERSGGRVADESRTGVGRAHRGRRGRSWAPRDERMTAATAGVVAAFVPPIPAVRTGSAERRVERGVEHPAAELHARADVEARRGSFQWRSTFENLLSRCAGTPGRARAEREPRVQVRLGAPGTRWA